MHIRICATTCVLCDTLSETFSLHRLPFWLRLCVLLRFCACWLLFCVRLRLCVLLHVCA
jgi:hypothetical protein